MLWLVLLTFATYFQSLVNGFISDDITINSQLQGQKYPVFTPKAFEVFTNFFDCLEWKLFKKNAFLHHLLSTIFFSSLVCSFYFVAKQYIPQPAAFIASVIFAVHPCNNQIGAWISAKWWGVSCMLALWGLYFNNIGLYIFSCLFSPITVPFVLLYKVPWIIKVICIIIALFILKKELKDKVNMNNFEGEYKCENLKIYPRKIIVMIKSFCYYFTLAFFPLKMGWFHEMGEPINDDLKRMNRHFWLCILLIITMLIFIKLKAFLGLFLFVLFIAPFSNFITLALFTSERYMAPSIMGWSIFLGFILHQWPVVLAVIATIYFMRTQLQLWSFRGDFQLALSSLINFENSGYALTNFANILIAIGRPSAAFDMLKHTESKLPEFPTTYWLLYTMYRATDLLNNFDLAYINLEKACRYGKHIHWFEELDRFRKLLLTDRATKFRIKYVTGHITPQ